MPQASIPVAKTPILALVASDVGKEAGCMVNLVFCYTSDGDEVMGRDVLDGKRQVEDSSTKKRTHHQPKLLWFPTRQQVVMRMMIPLTNGAVIVREPQSKRGIGWQHKVAKSVSIVKL